VKFSVVTEAALAAGAPAPAGKQAQRANSHRWWLAAAVVFWSAAIIGGIAALTVYKHTPAADATPPMRWPAESRIPRPAARATLIMLAHPHCPCTRASVGELSLLMARLQGQLTAFVLFVVPQGSDRDWTEGDLWSSAAAIPGVTVMADYGGREAELFRAKTSGQVEVYDAEGRLIFSGGITAARGHSGDNPGRSRIVSLLTEGAADHARSAVYGCALKDADEP
jgi:hypothetical protein